jgi:hypothetical protein
MALPQAVQYLAPSGVSTPHLEQVIQNPLLDGLAGVGSENHWTQRPAAAAEAWAGAVVTSAVPHAPQNLAPS